MLRPGFTRGNLAYTKSHRESVTIHLVNRCTADVMDFFRQIQNDFLACFFLMSPRSSIEF